MRFRTQKDSAHLFSSKNAFDFYKPIEIFFFYQNTLPPVGLNYEVTVFNACVSKRFAWFLNKVCRALNLFESVLYTCSLLLRNKLCVIRLLGEQASSSHPGYSTPPHP